MFENESTEQTGVVKTGNTVAVLGIVSFCSSLSSYLLCGVFVLISITTGRRSVDNFSSSMTLSMMALVISWVASAVGLVTGIVGTTIKRKQKQEGRGLAIAGLAVSGAYILIMLILIVIGLLAMMSLGSLMRNFD